MLRRCKLSCLLGLAVVTVGIVGGNATASKADEGVISIVAPSGVLNAEGIGLLTGVLKMQELDEPLEEVAEDTNVGGMSNGKHEKYEGDYDVDWSDTFSVTAYCNCIKCCGKYSPEAGGKGTTKSGKYPEEGRTVAADPSVLPLGTKVMIQGHIYTVEDTGSAVLGNVIDMYFDSHSACLQWGRRSLNVKVLK